MSDDKIGKCLKFFKGICKRFSIAKHSHGLYYKDMQSYSSCCAGICTIFGVVLIFIYAGVIIDNILNKRFNQVQIFHGKIDLPEFTLREVFHKLKTKVIFY